MYDAQVDLKPDLTASSFSLKALFGATMSKLVYPPGPMSGACFTAMGQTGLRCGRNRYLSGLVGVLINIDKFGEVPHIGLHHPKSHDCKINTLVGEV